ncbi:MAG: NADPH:quinone reductase [Natronomonas sp.]
MRAVRFHEHGDPDVLRVEEIETPTPGAGEIRVEVRATSVNPVDTYLRSGAFQPPTMPAIPGKDFAGIVDETGPDVTEYTPGDRVFGSNLGTGTHGTTAEFMVTPTEQVARLPEDVSFETAGVTGVAAMTPWRALIDHAALEPGEYCLIHGGNGGVGHVGVQIAAGLGSRVITTARPQYHDRLSDLGAHAVLDYDRDDLASAITEAAAEPPSVVVDHMLEKYLQLDCDVAAHGARIVLYRNRHDEAKFTDLHSVGGKELQFNVMSSTNAPELSESLSRLGRLLSDGWIDIEIADTYQFSELPEAHRRVREKSFFGKLAIVP